RPGRGEPGGHARRAGAGRAHVLSYHGRMRLALVALLCACASAPVAKSDPLADLNRIARAAYADARSRAVADAGPVLIVGPARITFLNGGSRRQFDLTSQRYQDLKSMSHLALGLHSLFFRAAGDSARLAELRTAASRALEALHDLTSAELDRQRELVRLS